MNKKTKECKERKKINKENILTVVKEKKKEKRKRENKKKEKNILIKIKILRIQKLERE